MIAALRYRFAGSPFAVLRMNANSDTPPRHAIRALTPLEARVLGVLVEKEHTVPDTYPLSVNALLSGCNQKTARTPVMNATEAGDARQSR
jgi:uncharacterized protein